MHDQDKLMFVETVGSVLWFVMDGFWMLNSPAPAKTMIMPTLIVNLFVFRYTRRSLAHLAVVAAMNSWLAMNIFWMVGDLDKAPDLIAIARVLFASGILLLVVAVASTGLQRERLTKAMSHFRRLRI